MDLVDPPKVVRAHSALKAKTQALEVNLSEQHGRAAEPLQSSQQGSTALAPSAVCLWMEAVVALLFSQIPFPSHFLSRLAPSLHSPVRGLQGLGLAGVACPLMQTLSPLALSKVILRRKQLSQCPFAASSLNCYVPKHRENCYFRNHCEAAILGVFLYSYSFTEYVCPAFHRMDLC